MRSCTSVAATRLVIASTAALLLIAPLGVPAASATSGTLVLTQSTTLTADHYGSILFAADGITLEGAGHTVRAVTGSTHGVALNGHSRVTVRNVITDGFPIGFSVENTSGNVLVGNKAFGGTLGFFIFQASDNTVTRNSASSAELGFALNQATGNRIERNVASSNSRNGFDVYRGSNGNDFVENVANGNGTSGWSISVGSSGNTFRENVASDNARIGFSIYANATGNLLTQNRATGNGEYGFAVQEGSTGNTLRENRACKSGIVDLYQDASSAPNTYDQNRFCRTEEVGDIEGSPANPNASTSARKALRYLAGLPNHSEARVVSGQYIASTATDIVAWDLFYDEIRRQTEKDVGLVGVDVEGNGWCAPDSTDEWCQGITGVNFDQQWMDKVLSHWNQGGLVTLHWHAHNPWTGGPVNTTDGTGGTAMDQLITPGSPVYANWMATLDQLADGLRKLQDAGVVVLWRPFHEMNAPTFWWGSQNDPASYVRVWRHMFDYFTTTKGLNNLLWIYAPVVWPGLTALGQYPGDGYVDILGLDFYPATQSFTTQPAYTELAAKGKVLALTEYGYRGPGLGDDVNVIDSIESSMPLLSYVMFWNDLSDRSYSMTSNLNADGFMDHPWIIDRSELPRL